MLPNSRDDDHLLALFKRGGHWGAVAKSNFVGLRYREPIFRTLRELVLSYFEQFYNVEGEKTLRGYTVPMNLRRFDRLPWMTEDAPLDLIADHLDEIRSYHPGQGRTPYEEVGYRRHQVGTVEKCDFCLERLEDGREPACVANCPAVARIFGDLDDPESDVSQLIRRGHAFQLLPEMETDPSVYYLPA